MVTGRGEVSSRPVVVDASAVLGWLVEGAAVAVLEQLLEGESGSRSARFVAPAHLPIEVSNALIAGADVAAGPPSRLAKRCACTVAGASNSNRRSMGSISGA